MSALAGIRVVDLTSVLLGPYATQILSDFGADIIKVESPEGDIVRQIGPGRHPTMGGMFLNVNRGKRSIVLDLKNPHGREAFMRLISTADVLVYNLRPQAMERLGLSYNTISAENPRIVYAGMFGYGSGGPYSAFPAYDDLIQGAVSIPSLIGMSGGGEPRYVPMALVDRFVGIYGVGAILAALHHRDRTGQGQQVDIPMFETMASVVLGDHLGGLTFEPPLDEGGYQRLLSVDRRPYRTLDGYICAMIYNDKQWKSFFKAIGREDMLDDPIFQNHSSRTSSINKVYKFIGEVFTEKTTEEWVKILRAVDIPAMPVNTLDSLLGDPHLAATKFFEHTEHPTEGPILSLRQPTTWSKSPPVSQREAPNLGEHNVEILGELGYSHDEIAAYFPTPDKSSCAPHARDNPEVGL